MSKGLLQKSFTCPPPSPHLCLTRTPVQRAISVLVEEQSGCCESWGLWGADSSTQRAVTATPGPIGISTLATATLLPLPIPLLPHHYHHYHYYHCCTTHLTCPDLTCSSLHPSCSQYLPYMKLNRVDQCIANKMYTLNIICLSVLFWAKQWHYGILFSCAVSTCDATTYITLSSHVRKGHLFQIDSDG